MPQFLLVILRNIDSCVALFSREGLATVAAVVTSYRCNEFTVGLIKLFMALQAESELKAI